MPDHEKLTSSSIHGAIKRQLDSLVFHSPVKFLIFTHRQADPDALCAAEALNLLIKSSFSQFSFESKIITPQGGSNLGNNVSLTLKIGFQEKIESSSIQQSDLIFIVDAGDFRLLDPFAEELEKSPARKILIDHHFSSLDSYSWPSLSERVVNSDATSTCEMIALGFPAELISKNIAQILMAGLLFDSQHLGIATESTLEAALILVKAGSEVSAAKKILRYKPDRSELLGRLKAAQRLKYEEVAGRIVARSEISSYHAAVARMLVEIGADVGIAFGKSNGEARLSARSSQSFLKETGIDLAYEIKKVADHYDIIGGGHATAASLSGNVEPGVLADHLVQNLKARLLQK